MTDATHIHRALLVAAKTDVSWSAYVRLTIQGGRRPRPDTRRLSGCLWLLLCALG